MELDGSSAAHPGHHGRKLLCRTRSPDETEALGVALGQRAFAGAVLLLDGPLGAGKTVLTRGVARGLEVSEPVTSPSFTILAIHHGRLPLYHLDLYRVSSAEELRSLDLDEIFGSRAVVVVEWPRWLTQAFPPGALSAEIEIEGPEVRRIVLAARDERWEAALDTLAACTE